MAKAKRASRKSAARKAPKTRKGPAAAKKAAKNPVVARKAKAVGANSAKAAELDARIAIVRNNLRTLVEQAASVTGASAEELLSQRIAEQEAKLEELKKQRDALSS